MLGLSHFYCKSCLNQCTQSRACTLPRYFDQIRVIMPWNYWCVIQAEMDEKNKWLINTSCECLACCWGIERGCCFWGLTPNPDLFLGRQTVEVEQVATRPLWFWLRWKVEVGGQGGCFRVVGKCRRVFMLPSFFFICLELKAKI